MDSAILDLFFGLLRLGLETDRVNDDSLAVFRRMENGVSGLEWEKIYKLGVRQGVAAIMFDGLQQLSDAKAGLPFQMPDKMLIMKWFAHYMQVKKHCASQLRTASELAGIYAEHGIRTVVLKGIAAGLDYPRPDLRPCGDLDCFLVGGYKRGNEIAKACGAFVDDHSYKHSHIEYKGLTIENHQFCTPISGSQRTKRLERLLQSILETEGTTMIGDTHLECPSPMFNALFLTHHAQRHFLSEGIALRHLCDWAMLLHRHANEISWQEFKAFCKEYGMGRFVESMTRLSRNLLHINIPDQYMIPNDDEADEYMLHEILSEESGPSAGPLWKQHLDIIRNIFQNRKRYKVFSDQSYLHNICQLACGFIFDRHPHL